jgi:hypothetical protein
VAAVRFRVTYGRNADFLGDAAQQLTHGGLLVKVSAALERGAAIELVVVAPAGTATATGRVLQPLPGGVAVELDGCAGAFATLIDAARRAPDQPAGAAPRHELLDDEPAPRPIEGAAAREQAQKIQVALHGDKNQRMAILRDSNRMLHGYVLRNPQLQLDEVVFLARSSTTSAETLTFIAGRREWAERGEVAIALVRNPKTPVPLAIRMLDHVSASELRMLAKQSNVREQIQRVARKKVIG